MPLSFFNWAESNLLSLVTLESANHGWRGQLWKLGSLDCWKKTFHECFATKFFLLSFFGLVLFSHIKTAIQLPSLATSG